MTNAQRRQLRIVTTMLAIIIILGVLVLVQTMAINDMMKQDKMLKDGNRVLQDTVVELQNNNVDLTNHLEDTVDKLNELQAKYDDLSRRAVILPKQTSSANRGGGLATPRVYKMVATAYNMGTTTASGTKVQNYRTIAAPSYIPFGTIVYIPQLASGPNHGIYVVEDRGGDIHGARIDVYMSSHRDAIQFGRQEVDMYIIR